MSQKRKINISEPVTGEEEWLAVKEPLMSGWLMQGPKVKKFEELFAKRHKVKHAIAVTSATTALHMATAALDIKPGDEVIVPSFTWIATANSVLYQGGKVVFCDIDTKTFNVDLSDLKKRITKKTKAIIPVHLFGLPADMESIIEIAGNIPIIEDAACAAGSEYKGTPVGSFGAMACFSFHPRKSITTGEGGMVTTNDDKLAEKLLSLRNHGASVSNEEKNTGKQPYLLPDFDILGYNYRMTDIQAAMGIPQLKKMDKFIDERQNRADYYKEQLKNIDWLTLPETASEYRHGWQSFVTMVDESKSPASRNEIMKRLYENGIVTRPGTHAVHMLGLYKNLYNLKEGDYPGARDANNFSMAIPLHNKMTEEDYEYVVECLKAIK